MVDNLAEKVDECPLNRGPLSIACVNWDRENCPLYGVSAIQGLQSIEVNGRAVGTFRIVRYIVGVHYSGVSIKWGSTVCKIRRIRIRSGFHIEGALGFHKKFANYDVIIASAAAE